MAPLPCQAADRQPGQERTDKPARQQSEPEFTNAEAAMDHPQAVILCKSVHHGSTAKVALDRSRRGQGVA
jgi:hypothetical protein